MRGLDPYDYYPQLPAAQGFFNIKRPDVGHGPGLGHGFVLESWIVAGRYFFQMQSTGSSLLAPGTQWYQSRAFFSHVLQFL